MRVERLKIPAGEVRTFVNDGEAFIHPLVGSGDVGGTPIGGRSHIFGEFPDGLLISGNPFIVSAKTDLDVVIATHPLVGPKPVVAYHGVEVKAKMHTIGSGTARREVREILGDGGPSIALRCGETVNKPGGWSSWPPHRFDDDPEVAAKFEEIFFVFTDPRDSYAIIKREGIWKSLDSVNDVVVARSGDRVEVPLGRHPIVGAPGTRVMYVWFYVGATKHYARWAEDLGGYR